VWTIDKIISLITERDTVIKYDSIYNITIYDSNYAYHLVAFSKPVCYKYTYDDSYKLMYPVGTITESKCDFYWRDLLVAINNKIVSLYDK
jgi:hypothetical protein